MIRGIYNAAAGMVANFRRQMVIADNVANVSTIGYKQGIATFADAPEMQIFGTQAGQKGIQTNRQQLGSVGMGTQLKEVQPDFTQGDLVETGNPLDIAVNGSGFLAVQTAAGVLFTRDGTLFRDAEGYLVRADGGLVLGYDGPIQVGQGDILIDGDGTVSVNGQEAGRIALFDLNGSVSRVGFNYVTPQDADETPTPSQESSINQGFLEGSNVDVSQAMVDMMEVARLYETSQRIFMLQDQTLEKVVNEVGRV